MTNLEIYANAFANTFSKAPNEVADLKYQSIEEWDSIGHMSLISALEECFGVMMETDDIVEFSSYAKGIEILGKYGVDL